MEKIDLFKLHKAEYKATEKPALIEIAKATYLAIEGVGEPGGSVFAESIEAMYAIAYTVKMTRKKENKGDYVICKLECLYKTEPGKTLDNTSKENWHWQLLIRTPDMIEEQDLKNAAEVLLSKHKTPLVSNVSLCSVTLGHCVQMLHIGPYEDECISIEKMLDYAAKERLTPLSNHEEVYISDPRRVVPEKLKTILRMPVDI